MFGSGIAVVLFTASTMAVKPSQSSDSGYQECSCSEREVEHSPLSTAKIKNASVFVA
jgi:hypothetical protein